MRITKMLWLVVIATGIILAVGVVNIWPNSLTDNEIGIGLAIIGTYALSKSGRKR